VGRIVPKKWRQILQEIGSERCCRNLTRDSEERLDFIFDTERDLGYSYHGLRSIVKGALANRNRLSLRES
jgi:hypothetical protein